MAKPSVTPALALLGALVMASLCRGPKPSRPRMVFDANRHVLTRPEGAGWLKRSGNARYYVNGERMEVWERPDGTLFFNKCGEKFWLERRGSGPLLIVRPHTCSVSPPPFRRTFKTRPAAC